MIVALLKLAGVSVLALAFAAWLASPSKAVAS